jgi:hypothetical protein
VTLAASQIWHAQAGSVSLPLTRQQKERVEIAEPVERVEDLHSVPMEKRSGGGGWGWDVPGVPLRADALLCLSDRSNAVGCLSRARIVSTKGLISLATSLASIVLQVVYEQERISGCFGDMSDAMRCCACDSASIVRTRASSA